MTRLRLAKPANTYRNKTGHKSSYRITISDIETPVWGLHERRLTVRLHFPSSSSSSLILKPPTLGHKLVDHTHSLFTPLQSNYHGSPRPFEGSRFLEESQAPEIPEIPKECYLHVLQNSNQRNRRFSGNWVSPQQPSYRCCYSFFGHVVSSPESKCSKLPDRKWTSA